MSGTRFDQPTEHGIQSGFAGTIATQQGHRFARHDFQIDTTQHLNNPITGTNLFDL
jgi:hypothetical protein